MDECESIQGGNTKVISSILLCTLSNSAAARRCDLSFLERIRGPPNKIPLLGCIMLR
jgi:hypothetical protein